MMEETALIVRENFATKHMKLLKQNLDCLSGSKKNLASDLEDLIQTIESKKDSIRDEEISASLLQSLIEVEDEIKLAQFLQVIDNIYKSVISSFKHAISLAQNVGLNLGDICIICKIEKKDAYFSEVYLCSNRQEVSCICEKSPHPVCKKCLDRLSIICPHGLYDNHNCCVSTCPACNFPYCPLSRKDKLKSVTLGNVLDTRESVIQISNKLDKLCDAMCQMNAEVQQGFLIQTEQTMISTEMPNNKRKNGSKEIRSCRNCGQKGHYAKTCAKREKRLKNLHSSIQERIGLQIQSVNTNENI